MKIQLPEYIEVLDTRDNNNDLKTIRYKNKFIHSLYNPLKEAEKELERYDINQYDVIIVFGLGMGYILTALSYKLKKKNTKIIAIESEKYFSRFIPFKKQDNIILFFNENSDKVCNILFSFLNQYSLKKILFIELNSLMDINRDYYNDIKNKIKIHLEQKVADVTTTTYCTEQWLFNSFINFRFLKKHIFINNLKNKFNNSTGLLVSSGPSIEEDIQYIKSFKGIIFSLPPSVNYLLKNNIIPDFIILGDSNYYNHYHLMRARNLNIPLLADLSIHYTLLKAWNGPIILFSYNILGLEFFYKNHNVGYVPQGGTVASVAVSAMKYLGFQNIVLSGQDFAYKDFKLHVKGSGYEYFHIKKINRFKSLFNLNFELIKKNKLEYKNGKIVDHKLKLYKDWFEKLIKTININIIDNKASISGENKKEEILFKQTASISIEKDLVELKKDLKKMQIYLKDSQDDFLENLKNNKQIYNLVKGFAGQDFLKIEQGLDIKKEEFFQNMKTAFEKIEWLIEYNLRE